MVYLTLYLPSFLPNYLAFFAVKRSYRREKVARKRWDATERALWRAHKERGKRASGKHRERERENLCTQRRRRKRAQLTHRYRDPTTLSRIYVCWWNSWNRIVTHQTGPGQWHRGPWRKEWWRAVEWPMASRNRNHRCRAAAPRASSCHRNYRRPHARSTRWLPQGPCQRDHLELFHFDHPLENVQKEKRKVNVVQKFDVIIIFSMIINFLFLFFFLVMANLRLATQGSSAAQNVRW